METYIGVKIIKAEPMTRNEWANKKNMEHAQMDEPGYKVQYADGYISWSPKKAFELAYRRITEEEKFLV